MSSIAQLLSDSYNDLSDSYGAGEFVIDEMRKVVTSECCLMCARQLWMQLPVLLQVLNASFLPIKRQLQPDRSGPDPHPSVV